MLRLITIAVIAGLVSLPVAAQTKGKSETAPGQTGVTPGQQQQGSSKTGKDFAPGQKQETPGGAKDLAPGAKQRK